MKTLLQDLRYGLRVLAKKPGFTAMAVLTLALGIGANTAIFSLIDTVMLRSLPVEKPEELVQLRLYNPAWGKDGSPIFTNPLWEQVRDQQDVFSGAFAWGGGSFDLARGGAVQNANGFVREWRLLHHAGRSRGCRTPSRTADDRRGCPSSPSLVTVFGRVITAARKAP